MHCKLAFWHQLGNELMNVDSRYLNVRALGRHPVTIRPHKWQTQLRQDGHSGYSTRHSNIVYLQHMQVQVI